MDPIAPIVGQKRPSEADAVVDVTTAPVLSDIWQIFNEIKKEQEQKRQGIESKIGVLEAHLVPKSAAVQNAVAPVLGSKPPDMVIEFITASEKAFSLFLASYYKDCHHHCDSTTEAEFKFYKALVDNIRYFITHNPSSHSRLDELQEWSIIWEAIFYQKPILVPALSVMPDFEHPFFMEKNEPCFAAIKAFREVDMEGKSNKVPDVMLSLLVRLTIVDRIEFFRSFRTKIVEHLRKNRIKFSFEIKWGKHQVAYQGLRSYHLNFISGWRNKMSPSTDIQNNAITIDVFQSPVKKVLNNKKTLFFPLLENLLLTTDFSYLTDKYLEKFGNVALSFGVESIIAEPDSPLILDRFRCLRRISQAFRKRTITISSWSLYANHEKLVGLFKKRYPLDPPPVFLTSQELLAPPPPYDKSLYTRAKEEEAILSEEDIPLSPYLRPSVYLENIGNSFPAETLYIAQEYFECYRTNYINSLFQSIQNIPSALLLECRQKLSTIPHLSAVHKGFLELTKPGPIPTLSVYYNKQQMTITPRFDYAEHLMYVLLGPGGQNVYFECRDWLGYTALLFAPLPLKTSHVFGIEHFLVAALKVLENRPIPWSAYTNSGIVSGIVTIASILDYRARGMPVDLLFTQKSV